MLWQIDANSMLVKMVLGGQPELVAHLLGRLQEAVHGNSEWGTRNDVLEFLVQLANNRGHRVLRR